MIICHDGLWVPSWIHGENFQQQSTGFFSGGRLIVFSLHGQTWLAGENLAGMIFLSKVDVLPTFAFNWSAIVVPFFLNQEMLVVHSGVTSPKFDMETFWMPDIQYYSVKSCLVVNFQICSRGSWRVTCAPCVLRRCWTPICPISWTKRTAIWAAFSVGFYHFGWIGLQLQ